MKAKLRAHKYKLRKAANTDASTASSKDAGTNASTDAGKASLAIERIMVNGKPVAASEIEIPITYKQAEKTPYWQYWK
ncbi:hypothetical protein N7522_008813 [Penicillium canescens]|nr:hypothetical protein N7522_008813 [Penicillium canescens]